MDPTTLVGDLVNDGKKIVEHLPRKGFEVNAAFWIKEPDNGEWYFYIASPLAETEQLNRASGKMFALIREIPDLHWIDPFAVRLIGPNHPMTKDAVKLLGSRPSPLRWNGNALGNMKVEESLIYPLPVLGGRPILEPVAQMLGVGPMGGWKPLGGWEPLGGFIVVATWGDAALGTPIVYNNGNAYRLEPQYNHNGYLMLRNLSGGASLGFAEGDPIDHNQFHFDKIRA